MSRACQECESGELKVRAGASGFFMACSNFPECRYTESLQPEEDPEPVGPDRGEPRGVVLEELVEQGIAELEARAARFGVAGPKQIYRDMAAAIPGFGSKKSEELTDEERELRLDYMMQALAAGQLKPLPYDKEDRLAEE